MHPPENENLVALAGDWHGNGGWIQAVLPAIGRAGVRTVFQLGDFGIWDRDPRRDEAVRSTAYWARVADVTVFVTGGNHENYDTVEEIGVARATPPGEPVELAPRVYFLPRAYSWQMRGRTFASLSGAASHDRAWRLRYMQRKPRPIWWAQEEIRDADIEALASSLPGPADVMLSHEAPELAAPAVIAERTDRDGRDPEFWDETADGDYVRASVEKMTRAHQLLDPRLHFHGHYHVHDALVHADGSEVVSVGADGDPRGGTLLLDIDKMSWQVLVDDRLDRRYRGIARRAAAG